MYNYIVMEIEREKTTLRFNLCRKLGKVIRYHRLQLGMTQNQLAYYSGLNRAYIGHVERGLKNITIKNLEKIARALHMSGSTILGLAEIPPPYIYYTSMIKRVVRGRKREKK